MTQRPAPIRIGIDPTSRSTVEWEERYAGVVAIAYIDGRRVAGISGPWSGKYALTWWDRPIPARQLELYDSLEEARAEIEAWALRMQSGLASPTPVVQLRGTGPAAAETPAPAPGLLTRLSRLLQAPRWRRRRTQIDIDELRRLQRGLDEELADLHFSAMGEAPSKEHR